MSFNLVMVPEGPTGPQGPVRNNDPLIVGFIMERSLIPIEKSNVKKFPKFQTDFGGYLNARIMVYVENSVNLVMVPGGPQDHKVQMSTQMSETFLLFRYPKLTKNSS